MGLQARGIPLAAPLPMPNAEILTALAVVPPGLEAVAAQEVSQLGAESVEPLRGAVAFRIDRAGFYRLHLQARLPFLSLIHI